MSIQQLRAEIAASDSKYLALATQEKLRLKTEIALILKSKKDSGASISQLCREYGTKDRRTVTNLIASVSLPQGTTTPATDTTRPNLDTKEPWLFQGHEITWNDSLDMWDTPDTRVLVSPEFLTYLKENS